MLRFTVGGKIALTDVNPTTGNMCPDALEYTIENLQKDGVKPKLVSVVHLGGSTDRLSEIFDICEHHDIPVLEDRITRFGWDVPRWQSYWFIE